VKETLDTRDIQGLVLRGYGRLHGARFLVCAVEEGREEPARDYLRELCLRIDRASEPTGELALQVAFTAPGLDALGVPHDALQTFSREFLEGMDDDVRAESLGDRGLNDPSLWAWGRRARDWDAKRDRLRDRSDVHVLVMIYAHTQALQTLVDTERARALAGGLRIVREQHTTTLPAHKEHFGFRDGLSMPVIEGVPEDRPRAKHQDTWTDPLKPGEFVLGYRNEYNSHTERPTAAPADDPANHLRPTPHGRKNLGRSGTYLVYREMTQDVFEFWNHLALASREPGHDAATRATALAAKMVGRWPNGAPLIASPDRDDDTLATVNDFRYAEDLAGMSCPVGSHVRRANPRDDLGSNHDAGDSVIMVRKHQMIRRGRAFGPPISPTMNPHEILATRRDDLPRGLHFICLVGHISRQFEFVQRAWIHSPNFGALFKDGDPISAARRTGDNRNDEFTCPAVPVRRKYKELPQFTRLVGGAYFFLPGLAALRFIARAPA
jgi:Dyp-type peroxidase family